MDFGDPKKGSHDPKCPMWRYEILIFTIGLLYRMSWKNFSGFEIFCRYRISGIRYQETSISPIIEIPISKMSISPIISCHTIRHRIDRAYHIWPTCLNTVVTIPCQWRSDTCHGPRDRTGHRSRAKIPRDLAQLCEAVFQRVSHLSFSLGAG